MTIMNLTNNKNHLFLSLFIRVDYFDSVLKCVIKEKIYTKLLRVMVNILQALN